jgi:hypothetical protein
MYYVGLQIWIYDFLKLCPKLANVAFILHIRRKYRVHFSCETGKSYIILLFLEPVTVQFNKFSLSLPAVVTTSYCVWSATIQIYKL